MLDNVARFFLAVNLDIVHAGVCHVTEDKVDHAIATQERDRRYRTVFFQTFDMSGIVFKTNDTQCFH